MTRDRIVLFLAIAALSIAAPNVTSAGVPNREYSTVPSLLRLVGSHDGVPDSAAGRFVVIVRRFPDAPVAGANIAIDFSGCPDLQIASDPMNTTVTVNCAWHTVSAIAGPDGSFAFTVLGSSRSSGAYSGLGCARVYGDGVLLGSPTVAAFDLDGAGGLSSADISDLLADIGSKEYRGQAADTVQSPRSP